MWWLNCMLKKYYTDYSVYILNFLATSLDVVGQAWDCCSQDWGSLHLQHKSEREYNSGGWRVYNSNTIIVVVSQRIQLDDRLTFNHHLQDTDEKAVRVCMYCPCTNNVKNWWAKAKPTIATSLCYSTSLPYGQTLCASVRTTTRQLCG